MGDKYYTNRVRYEINAYHPFDDLGFVPAISSTPVLQRFEYLASILGIGYPRNHF